MMPTKLEVILSPAEFANLAARDLGRSTCVVFDILRAKGVDPAAAFMARHSHFLERASP